MSDPGDKSRRDVTPLPRTNRPRPETGSGRRRFDSTSSRDGAPATARNPILERRNTPDSGEKVSGPISHPISHTAVFGISDEAPAVLAERPTQLDQAAPHDRDTAPSNATADLKQVTLMRADGSAARTEGPTTAAAYLGCVIDGRYRIDGVLGRGGMGVVYRAKHEVIDKIVAIKILLPTEDREVVERFVNEARAATAIGNAHIVDTVDFGTLPDASTYFVMEYLEGQTLAKRIKAEKHISVGRAIGIGKQIAEGMSAAHKAGIVHRDLKPENTFLLKRDGGSDFVKLLDFGIAKMQHVQNKITRAGTIFGTPHYMSPEQAAGREVDPRTDIYSLGVMLYEMLAGKVPFDAENPMGLLTQHLYTEPVPLTRLENPAQEIPAQLDAVILKCLAKAPEERYATMADLDADLVRVERGEPPAALADLLARARRDEDEALLAAAKAGMRPRRRRNVAPFVVTGTVLLLAGGALAALTYRNSQNVVPPPAPRATAMTTSAPAPVQPKAAPKVAADPSVGLVFSPIDGQVYQDGKNLGGMPVTVPVPKGQTVDVEIRREGFYPEKVRLDGSKSVVVVRLTPIPGVQPKVPVPQSEPLDALRKASEAMLAPPTPSAAPLMPAVDHGAKEPTTPADEHAPPSTPAAAAPATPPAQDNAPKEAPAPVEEPHAPAPPATPPPAGSAAP